MTKRDLRKAARLLKTAARGLHADNTLADGSWFGETQAHADAYRKAHDELVRVSKALYAEARKPAAVDVAPAIYRSLDGAILSSRKFYDEFERADF